MSPASRPISGSSGWRAGSSTLGHGLPPRRAPPRNRATRQAPADRGRRHARSDTAGRRAGRLRARPGGLLDVALHPDFATNRLVYLSFSQLDGRAAVTAVARGVLEDNGLAATEVIFTSNGQTSHTRHFGSRLAFDAGHPLGHPWRPRRARPRPGPGKPCRQRAPPDR
ncbi:MAG: PQQ-dependent sugar dehydrogenase [Geminicoccaceae bacterium]